MLQRKNKSKNTQSGYNSGSGYESNNGYESTDSSPWKQLLKPLTSSSTNNVGGGKLKKSSSGISIASLTGNNDNKLHSSSTCGNTNCSTSNNNKQPKISIAKVKRNRFGTSPFDDQWLNLDCCGLICASLTYMLHFYGMYSFGWILLPPWFSVMDEDGYRELTFGCHFHRTFFILIASLAIYSHFKAMTTDPGAVPPDANPLPEPSFPITKAAATDNVDEEEQKKLDDLDNLIKGEPSPTKTRATHSTSSLMQEDNGNGMVSQAVVTAGAAVVGAAAIGAVGVAAAASAMGPIKANTNNTPQQPGQQRGKRMCRRCQAFKPPRAHHCSICKRCIIKMDYHCPWVNNCVGIGNHKYFLLFIFYTSLSCAYSFLFLVYRFFNCIGSSKHHGPRCVDHPTDLLPLVGLTVEALLFGLFTICMMVDQWDVVMTNLTHIDRLKGHGAMGGHSALISNVRAGINEVFGTGRHSMTSSTSSAATYSRFHYTWLSPLHKTCFPDTVRDDIFGYCRPCTTTRSGRGGSVEIV